MAKTGASREMSNNSISVLLSMAVSAVVSSAKADSGSATVSLISFSEVADTADSVAVVSRVIPHMLHVAAVPSRITAVNADMNEYSFIFFNFTFL